MCRKLTEVGVLCHVNTISVLISGLISDVIRDISHEIVDHAYGVLMDAVAAVTGGNTDDV